MLLAIAAAITSASAPAKMVVATANGVAITDYSSLERCRIAREALIKAWLADAQSRAPAGYRMSQSPPMSAVCIPG
jgi:hypothetical protein